jgi:hypothetical protein
MPPMGPSKQPAPASEFPKPAESELSPPIGEGEDDALILWMLSLSPSKRLEVAQGFVDSVQALRDGRDT